MWSSVPEGKFVVAGYLRSEKRCSLQVVDPPPTLPRRLVQTVSETVYNKISEEWKTYPPLQRYGLILKHSSMCFITLTIIHYITLLFNIIQHCFPKGNVHYIVMKTCPALAGIADQFIKWPSLEECAELSTQYRLVDTMVLFCDFLH